MSRLFQTGTRLWLVVDLGVGLWAWPLPMDFDAEGDGLLDFLGGAEDGHFYYLRNPRTKVLNQP